MTNVILLKQKIRESGVSITFLADRLNLSREGLYKKINGETEFKASEISIIQNVLHLSDRERDDIFFADQVELNAT